MQVFAETASAVKDDLLKNELAGYLFDLKTRKGYDLEQAYRDFRRRAPHHRHRQWLVQRGLFDIMDIHFWSDDSHALRQLLILKALHHFSHDPELLFIVAIKKSFMAKGLLKIGELTRSIQTALPSPGIPMDEKEVLLELLLAWFSFFGILLQDRKIHFIFAQDGHAVSSAQTFFSSLYRLIAFKRQHSLATSNTTATIALHTVSILAEPCELATIFVRDLSNLQQLNIGFDLPLCSVDQQTSMYRTIANLAKRGLLGYAAKVHLCDQKAGVNYHPVFELVDNVYSILHAMVATERVWKDPIETKDVGKSKMINSCAQALLICWTTILIHEPELEQHVITILANVDITFAAISVVAQNTNDFDSVRQAIRACAASQRIFSNDESSRDGANVAEMCFQKYWHIVEMQDDLAVLLSVVKLKTTFHCALLDRVLATVRNMLVFESRVPEILRLLRVTVAENISQYSIRMSSILTDFLLVLPLTMDSVFLFSSVFVFLCSTYQQQESFRFPGSFSVNMCAAFERLVHMSARHGFFPKDSRHVIDDHQQYGLSHCKVITYSLRRDGLIDQTGEEKSDSNQRDDLHQLVGACAGAATWLLSLDQPPAPSLKDFFHHGVRDHQECQLDTQQDRVQSVNCHGDLSVFRVSFSNHFPTRMASLFSVAAPFLSSSHWLQLLTLLARGVRQPGVFLPADRTITMHLIRRIIRNSTQTVVTSYDKLVAFAAVARVVGRDQYQQHIDAFFVMEVADLALEVLRRDVLSPQRFAAVSALLIASAERPDANELFGVLQVGVRIRLLSATSFWIFKNPCLECMLVTMRSFARLQCFQDVVASVRPCQIIYHVMKDSPDLFVVDVHSAVDTNEGNLTRVVLDIARSFARSDPSYSTLFPHLLENMVKCGYHCVTTMFHLCTVLSSLRLLRQGDVGKIMYLADKIMLPPSQRAIVKKIFYEFLRDHNRLPPHPDLVGRHKGLFQFSEKDVAADREKRRVARDSEQQLAALHVVDQKAGHHVFSMRVDDPRLGLSRNELQDLENVGVEHAQWRTKRS